MYPLFSIFVENYSTMDKKVNYLVTNEEDDLWGLIVTTVGKQEIKANQIYPPATHPKGYYFHVDEGRVLNEFQLLYLTNGNGVFTYGNSKQSELISEGKMFFFDAWSVAHLQAQ